MRALGRQMVRQHVPRRRRVVRRCALLALGLLALTACSSTYTQGPMLSDADRCARWGGRWFDNQCHVEDLRP